MTAYPLIEHPPYSGPAFPSETPAPQLEGPPVRESAKAPGPELQPQASEPSAPVPSSTDRPYWLPPLPQAAPPPPPPQGPDGPSAWRAMPGAPLEPVKHRSVAVLVLSLLLGMTMLASGGYVAWSMNSANNLARTNTTQAQTLAASSAATLAHATAVGDACRRTALVALTVGQQEAEAGTLLTKAIVATVDQDYYLATDYIDQADAIIKEANTAMDAPAVAADVTLCGSGVGGGA